MEKNQKISHPPKNKGGRPTDYTSKKGDRICDIISTSSMGINKICEAYADSDLPKDAATVRKWRLQNPEFAIKYARAKLSQADIFAEECIEIADNSTPENVNKDRLRIDTRKWLASKLLPKQYGDRTLLEQKDEENEQLKEELRTLRIRLDEQNKRDF
jgi:hypothetical protein